MNSNNKSVGETKCGFWIVDGEWIQKLASKKVYATFFGLAGCLIYSWSGYFNATVTTIEKQFKISSTTVGVISSGYDLSAMLTSICLCYYASKQHRTRVMALSLAIFAVGFSLFGFAYLIYQPGEDAFTLDSTTFKTSLCSVNSSSTPISTVSASLGPQVIFFIGCFIAAIGSILFCNLGIAYLDDNVHKSKAPMFISVTNFVRMLGAPIGFMLASYCLKIYVNPTKSPTIPYTDPRWTGAWWLGWFIISTLGLLSSLLFAAERRNKQTKVTETSKATLVDYKRSVTRLIKNKVLMFDYAAGVFYMFGYHPFYRFQSKYLEVQYKVSASTAAYITGSLTLAFLSCGLLVAGVAISLLKPSARSIAAWNIVTSLVSVTGIVVYTMFGCHEASNTDLVSRSYTMSTCSAACDCSLVEYSPVCGGNNITYLSPCHAGCSSELIQEDGDKIFQNCSCIDLASAVPGVCPVDCTFPLTIFIIILCLNKFIAGTEATANFMLGIRCIDEQDKVLCLSLYEALLGVFAFIPSPILFGLIIDRSCVLWGGGEEEETGNCWLYDEAQLRYNLNLTAAGFILVGTLLDVGTWYHSKNVEIFDDVKIKNDTELKALN